MATSDPVRVVLTDHARKRAAEMGVLTKRVKRALREPELHYPKTDGTTMAIAEDLAVPYVVDECGARVAVTVLWRSHEERFER